MWFDGNDDPEKRIILAGKGRTTCEICECDIENGEPPAVDIWPAGSDYDATVCRECVRKAARLVGILNIGGTPG